MFKYLLIPLILAITISNCAGFSFDERKNMMGKAVELIKKYDTIQLYNIVDTGYCFDIYGKDGFLQIIDYVNQKQNDCKINIDSKNLKNVQNPSNTTDYILTVCGKNSENDNSKMFDLIFRFANYNNDKKILFIDIKKSLPNEFAPPIKPG